MFKKPCEWLRNETFAMVEPVEFVESVDLGKREKLKKDSEI